MLGVDKAVSKKGRSHMKAANVASGRKFGAGCKVGLPAPVFPLALFQSKRPNLKAPKLARL